MKFSSDSQRRAAFRNMNLFTKKSPYSISFCKVSNDYNYSKKPTVGLQPGNVCQTSVSDFVEKEPYNPDLVPDSVLEKFGMTRGDLKKDADKFGFEIRPARKTFSMVFSDGSSEVIDDEFAEKVLRKFGKTNNMFEAGFVLPSGKMVDLSKGQGFREKKHDSIIEDSDNSGIMFDKLREAMKDHKLMRVEVSANSPSNGHGTCSYVEVHHKPTEEQKEFIKSASREVQRLGKESSDDNASFLIEVYNNGKRKFYNSNSPKLYEVEKFLNEVDDGDME